MALVVLGTTFIIAIVLALVLSTLILLGIICLVYCCLRKRSPEHKCEELNKTATQDTTTSQNTTTSSLSTGVDASGVRTPMLRDTSHSFRSKISVDTLQLLEDTPNVGFTANDLPLPRSGISPDNNYGHYAFNSADTLSSSMCYNSLGKSISSSMFPYDTAALHDVNAVPQYRRCATSQAHMRQCNPHPMVSHGPSMYHLPRYQEVPLFVPIHWMNRHPGVNPYNCGATPPVNPYMVSPLIDDGSYGAPSVTYSYGGWKGPVDYEKPMSGFTLFQ